MICAVGFATNSETTVIGSMLISPIGGFLLQTVQRALTGHSMRGGLLLLIALLMVGVPFLSGLAAGVVPGSPNKEDKYDVLEARCKAVSQNRWLLLATTLVAFGAALVFGWEESVPIVGVGIATALLPPIVAAGFACTHRFADNTKRGEYVGYAFAVFFLNITMLTLGTVVATMLRKRELCDVGSTYCESMSAFVGKKWRRSKIVPSN